MGLAAFFKREAQRTNHHVDTPETPAEDSSEGSVLVPDSPLCYTVDIRRTKDHGAEVVVSLHNSSESPIFLRGAVVHYWFDEADGGTHDLFFPNMPAHHPLKMLQYEVLEGHFHLPNLDNVGRLHTRVDVDWKDDRGTQHHKVSQRLRTVDIHTRPEISRSA